MIHPAFKKSFLTLMAGVATITLLTSNAYTMQKNSSSNGVFVSGPDTAENEINFFLKTENINSVSEYSNWLKHNITYLKDHKNDIWTAPIETLRRRYGDCEDFAFLNTAILTIMGYQPKVLLLIKKQSSHAICIFKKNDNLIFFDNNNLIRTKFLSEKTLIKHLKKEYRYAFVEIIDHKRQPWIQRSINGVLVGETAF